MFLVHPPSPPSQLGAQQARTPRRLLVGGALSSQGGAFGATMRFDLVATGGRDGLVAMGGCDGLVCGLGPRRVG